MPTYDYECSSCKHTEEIIQRIVEDSLTQCPKCNKQTYKRVILSAPSINDRGLPSHAIRNKRTPE